MERFKNKKGFGFVDSGVKILIAIVIGSLLLGGTYALTKDTVMPTVKSKVESLFDYSGGDIKNKERINGDFNNDGIVDTSDLAIIMSEFANDFPSGYDKAIFDVNGDGELNGKDVVRTQKLIEEQKG